MNSGLSASVWTTPPPSPPSLGRGEHLILPKILVLLAIMTHYGGRDRGSAASHSGPEIMLPQLYLQQVAACNNLREQRVMANLASS